MSLKSDIETEELIESTVESLRVIQKKNIKTFIILLSITITSLTAGLYSYSSIYYGKKSSDDLVMTQKKIVKIIDNDASLEIVKDQYDFYVLKNNSNSTKISLTALLKQIRLEEYEKDTINTILINKVESILATHSKKQPFDGLNTNQRQYFEDLQIKLGDQYPNVNNQVKNILGELIEKNSLVSEYLSDSTRSFWVSTSALVFAIIISVIQLMQNSDNNLKLRILSMQLKSKADEDSK